MHIRNILVIHRRIIPIEMNKKRPFLFNSHHICVPSLIKWTGSKRSQAKIIASFVPPHDRYFEPFLGSGALLFYFAKKGSQASDIYAPLIGFWKMVRDNPKFLVDNYRAQWQALQEDFPGYFYRVRERFNKEKRPEDLNFLMRTCVNGIARFNRKGLFNNSIHLSRRGMNPSAFKNIVYQWSNRLSGVEFFVRDYADAFKEAKPNDFIYLDPPYLGNKQRYINDLDAERFYNELEKLNQRGVKWALSFDGARGGLNYKTTIPSGLYKREISIESGHSAIAKVLVGPIEKVTESLYLNY